MVFNVDTNIIIALASGIVSVSAAYVVVKKSIKNVTNKIKDNLKKEVKDEVKNELIDPMIQKLEKQHNDDLEKLTKQIEALTKTVNDWITQAEANQHKMNESAYEFRKSTLKGLIVQAHSAYTQMGNIPSIVMSTLEEIYENYTELGGNHFASELMEEIRNLPRV